MTDKDNKNPLTKLFIIKLLVFGALIAALLMVTKLPMFSQQDNTTVIYLTRHAEKITGPDAGRDPALNQTGNIRAQILAERLRDNNINHVHSSDYIRTRDTAAPLAKIAGVEIELYDPRDLPALAALIKEQGGRHLVVGHSNTIPATAIALGGEGFEPIDEKTEYDRLYTVRIHEDGTTGTFLSRYGIRYKPQE